jgi:hypothetical protein
MFKQECKKIFRPGRVILVILLSLIASLSLFANFWKITGEDFGPEDAVAMEVFSDIADRYGITLSDEELVQLQNYCEELRKSTDQTDEVEETRLMYYEEWARLLQSEVEIHQQYPSAEAWKQYLEEIHAQAGNWGITDFDTDAGVSQEIELRFDSHEYWRGIIWDGLTTGTSTYFSNLLVWTVIMLGVLLMPLLVGDRMNQVRPLQLSSRTGRKIYYRQYGAVLFCGFAITTVFLLVIGGAFLQNGTLKFLSCSIYGVLSHTAVVVMTYGQWWLLNILMLYLVCMGMSGLYFFLSQFAKNYVGMAVLLILVAVAAWGGLPYIYRNVFLTDNELYDTLVAKNIFAPWAPVWVCALICVVGVLLGFGTCVYRQREEL